MNTDRRLHRWGATLLMPLLVWLPLTGTTLAIYQIFNPPESFEAPGERRGDDARPQTALPDKNTWPKLLATVVAAAQHAGAHAGAQRISVRLYMLDHRPVGTVIWNGDRSHASNFDAVTGMPVPSPGADPPRGIGPLLLGLHAGVILGPTGQLIIAMTGAMVVALWFTGLRMYLAMYSRQRPAQKDIFWR